jgi:hypothetical protein
MNLNLIFPVVLTGLLAFVSNGYSQCATISGLVTNTGTLLVIQNQNGVVTTLINTNSIGTNSITQSDCTAQIHATLPAGSYAVSVRTLLISGNNVSGSGPFIKFPAGVIVVKNSATWVGGLANGILYLTGTGQAIARAPGRNLTFNLTSSEEIHGNFTSIDPAQMTGHPTDLTVNKGERVQFDVTAIGPGPLIYRWRKNSINLTDNARVTGTATSSLIITNALQADEGTYSVMVSNTVNTLVSSNAVLVVHSPPSITLQPTSKLKTTQGTGVTLRVPTSGSTPLTYQWAVGGVEIAGATQSSYAFIAQPVNNSTNLNYTVLITNLFGSIISSNANVIILPDILKPTVTITNPLANARTTSALIAGMALDNIRIVRVIYWITNINNGVITVSATSDATLHGTNLTKLNWDTTPTLLPGTNIVSVQSQDFQGNNSLVVTRTFFNKVPVLFTLTRGGDGNGTLLGKAAIIGDAPPTNNASLNIGEGYSIQAKPDTKSFFTNWTGSLGTITNPTLSFIMEPGVSLQANFVTNLFIGMAGSYDGLFYISSEVREETAGQVSALSVSSKGVYSGRLMLNGVSYGIAGSFDMSGQATNVISRAAVKGGRVVVAMTLLWNNYPRQIIGTVTGTNGGAWSADLHLIVASTNRTSSAYTVLIPPATNEASAAGGFGYALVTNKAGVVTLKGKLADGTSFTQTVPLSEAASVPVYVSLYANTGFLLGWMSIDPGLPLDPLGINSVLTWIKKPSRVTALYTNGFTNIIVAQGSIWTNPPRGIAVLPFTTNSPAALGLSGGDLATSLTYNVAVTTNNLLAKVAGSPTNTLTGSIDPKTGLLTVTFGNGNGKVTTVGEGAVLPNRTNAAGFFLGRTNSGSLDLH